MDVLEIINSYHNRLIIMKQKKNKKLDLVHSIFYCHTNYDSMSSHISPLSSFSQYVAVLFTSLITIYAYNIFNIFILKQIQAKRLVYIW